MTFSPSFHWNRPIFPPKGEVLVALSVFVSQYFPTNNHLFFNIHAKGAPIFLKFDLYFNIPYFISISLSASFFRLLCSSFVLWKVGGICRKRNVKILLPFGKSPRFSLKSTEREIKSPCFYLVWWALRFVKYICVSNKKKWNNSC